jgi:hypothetical protein
MNEEPVVSQVSRDDSSEKKMSNIDHVRVKLLQSVYTRRSSASLSGRAKGLKYLKSPTRKSLVLGSMDKWMPNLEEDSPITCSKSPRKGNKNRSTSLVTPGNRYTYEKTTEDVEGTLSESTGTMDKWMPNLGDNSPVTCIKSPRKSKKKRSTSLVTPGSRYEKTTEDMEGTRSESTGTVSQGNIRQDLRKSNSGGAINTQEGREGDEQHPSQTQEKRPLDHIERSPSSNRNDEQAPINPTIEKPQTNEHPPFKHSCDIVQTKSRNVSKSETVSTEENRLPKEDTIRPVGDERPGDGVENAETNNAGESQLEYTSGKALPKVDLKGESKEDGLRTQMRAVDEGPLTNTVNVVSSPGSKSEPVDGRGETEQVPTSISCESQSGREEPSLPPNQIAQVNTLEDSRSALAHASQSQYANNSSSPDCNIRPVAHTHKSTLKIMKNHSAPPVNRRSWISSTLTREKDTMQRPKVSSLIRRFSSNDNMLGRSLHSLSGSEEESICKSLTKTSADDATNTSEISDLPPGGKNHDASDLATHDVADTPTDDTAPSDACDTPAADAAWGDNLRRVGLLDEQKESDMLATEEGVIMVYSGTKSPAKATTPEGPYVYDVSPLTTPANPADSESPEQAIPGSREDEERSYHVEEEVIISSAEPSNTSPVRRSKKYDESFDSPHSSFQLQSPEAFKQKVILDFAQMEPSASVKRQHLQVINDLQNLMKKTKDEKDTEKQRSMKEKMLRDLLETSKAWEGDNGEDRKSKLNLTVDEVSDIVTHINLCEQTNTPIRWDLINDIVFPDCSEGEPEEQDGQTGKQPSGTSAPTEDQIGIPEMKMDDVDEDWGLLNDIEQDHEDAMEAFRRQYNLTEEEMAEVIAHLNLCEETNTEVRWDHVNRIIYPDDKLDVPPEMAAPLKEVNAAMDDCQSAITDGFDDGASSASWFSIYAEFDDCASSLTFLVDGDDIKVGKQSEKKKDEDTGESIERTNSFPNSGRRPPVPLNTRGRSPFGDKLTARKIGLLGKTSGAVRPDPVLRMRVNALRASNHSFIGASEQFTSPKRQNSWCLPFVSKKSPSDNPDLSGSVSSILLDEGSLPSLYEEEEEVWES